MSEMEMADVVRIRKRIEGRKAAGDIAELIGDLLHDRAYLAAFVEELQARFGEQHVEAQTPPPEPIGRLGSTLIEFGVYRGKTFDDVPLEYLDWLCRVQEDSAKRLRAYLKHPELEARRRGL